MEEVKRPLRDALAAPDQPELVTVTSGVVTRVVASGSPYTVQLQMPDGSTASGLPYPGWWAPRVGDVAIVLRQGGALTVLHAVAPCDTVTAPHRHKAADIDGSIIPPAPAPPPVPTPPAPAPTIVTRTVQPTAMGSWGGPSPADQMVQGAGNSAYWFYGTGIATARGSGTITGGTIYVERLATAHGVNGDANVRLGAHGLTGPPGSGGDITSVDIAARLARGQGRTVPLTPAHVAALNAGARGLGLARGAAGYASADYLRVTAGSPSGALSLTIQT